MALVFIFVGRLEIAAMVGALEAVSKMVLYYLHERGWNSIKAGKKAVEPFVLWFTGLPASGKTTLADRVHDMLSAKGLRVERLDGDTIRQHQGGTHILTT